MNQPPPFGPPAAAAWGAPAAPPQAYAQPPAPPGWGQPPGPPPPAQPQAWGPPPAQPPAAQWGPPPGAQGGYAPAGMPPAGPPGPPPAQWGATPPAPVQSAGALMAQAWGPAPQAMPPMVAVPAAEHDLNSAKDEADRFPRIEAGATCDCVVERVHKVPTRGKGDFVEFVFKVVRSNHPRMPVGHMWSIFQSCSFDGVDKIFRGIVLAIMGYSKEDFEALKAAGTPPDLNGTWRAIREPHNPAHGRMVRATAKTSIAGPRSKHAGKAFTDAKLSKYIEGAPLPELAAGAPAAQAAPPPPPPPPPAQFAAPPPVGPAAPVTPLPPHLWRNDADGSIWDLNTRSRVQ